MAQSGSANHSNTRWAGFQPYWRHLSLALQFVSDCFCFSKLHLISWPVYSWLLRMCVPIVLCCLSNLLIAIINGPTSLWVHFSIQPANNIELWPLRRYMLFGYWFGHATDFMNSYQKLCHCPPFKMCCLWYSCLPALIIVFLSVVLHHWL